MVEDKSSIGWYGGRYCEFVYVVSAIFVFPVWTQALVGLHLAPFLGDRYK